MAYFVRRNMLPVKRGNALLIQQYVGIRRLQSNSTRRITQPHGAERADDGRPPLQGCYGVTQVSSTETMRKSKFFYTLLASGTEAFKFHVAASGNLGALGRISPRRIIGKPDGRPREKIEVKNLKNSLQRRLRESEKSAIISFSTAG
ncbi:hypothetical protein [Streptomyces radiopugnans]|uniref:hypothetical protein n=1 Tax=Streptomyces radiopugnans TaxID=403935 RepID=UPI003F1C7C72